MHVRDCMLVADEVVRGTNEAALEMISHNNPQLLLARTCADAGRVSLGGPLLGVLGPC